MIEEILNDLYESEINVGIASFWDGGYHVHIGDDMNGYLYTDSFFETLDEAAEALKVAAINLFPQSDFARKHKV